MRLRVVSQSTLSSGHGRSVPVEGVRAAWRARRLPGQLRLYFSSRSSTAPPRSCFRTSKSSFPSVNASGKRALSCSMLPATRSGDLVSGSSAVSFFICIYPSECPCRSCQFSFELLDFKVQFHAAIELLFLFRLGAQNGEVALEPGVDVEAIAQGRCAVGGIRRSECP